MKRRLIGAAFGLVVALFTGFISLLSTGGGHGSFMWLFLFVIPNLCGLYFPLMGWLGANLSSYWTKLAFGCLLAVNFIISVVMAFSFSMNDPYTEKAWNTDLIGAGFVSAILFVPNVIFLILFILSFFYSQSNDDEQNLSIII